MTSVIWPLPPNGSDGAYLFADDQDFGYRDESSWGGDNFHNGIDFSNYPGGSAGIPIQAIASGTVTTRGEDYYLGNIVVIDHGGGLVSWYCHMEDGSHAHLGAGQPISQGALVGKIGDTGDSSDGPHLHLEIHVNGSRTDPQAFIRNNLGAGAGASDQEEDYPMLYLITAIDPAASPAQRWAVTGPGYWKTLTSQAAANAMSQRLGNVPAAVVNWTDWDQAYHAAKGSGYVPYQGQTPRTVT